jgi:MFS family permease
VLLSYAISIIGIILLWLLQYYPNFWLLGAFVVTFGRMIGSRGPLIAATTMKIFRGERVGTISIGSGLGSGLGAWAGGLIHDLTPQLQPRDRVRAGGRSARNDPFLVVLALRR